MKKYLSILLCSISLLAFSQKKSLEMDHENFFRLGIKGGLNLNKQSGESFKAGFRYNYQLGGFLQFNFSDRFGIQPEVSFVQTSSEFSDDANNVYDDLLGGGSQHKAKLNYIEVPVLLNTNIGPSKRVKLQFGPSYGGLLKQTIDSVASNANLFKKNEWSAIGGLWLQLPLVHIGARYKQGLTNINAIDGRQKWKNQAFQFFIGLTF